MHVALSVVAATLVLAAGPSTAATPTSDITMRSFVAESGLARAGRPTALTAHLENTGPTIRHITARLTPPAGASVASGKATIAITIRPESAVDLSWDLVASRPIAGDVRLTVTADGTQIAEATLFVRFLQSVPRTKAKAVPPPKPVRTQILIGAHNCPLWEADKLDMWSQIVKHPERTPALGFYAQENPEVADWETKWATEHGVSFFIYCWYRTSQGGPVTTMFSSAIERALYHSRYQNHMKYTIMWENQVRGRAGVSNERDLMENLLPYWIERYFKHPSYLKIDNKPVLFIYRPEYLVDDLGGKENVARAMDQMRDACRKAGFAGLILLGEYRGLDPDVLSLLKQLGMDYTFAYCWGVPNNPTPQQAIDAQMSYIRKTQELGIIPQVVTVSQGWTGWADEGSIWRIPPSDYEGLLRKAKDFIGTLPSSQLGSHMLLLDNWNEWGEGHFIAPFRQYGFGYLDAVRKVFTPNAGPHTDLLPEDVGMGPYDKAYRTAMANRDRVRKLARKRVLKTGAPAPGLIGWWTFDDPSAADMALDYSGNRLGGEMHRARHATGIDKLGLLCDGGCVLVPSDPLLSPKDALTIECWARSTQADQANTWIVNRVLSGGTDTGYRLGVLAGKPCFEIPLTEWSHHLSADVSIPTGRWVHLVGTFDGKTMRIYVNGVEHGSMERPGPIHPNNFRLCIGSYDADHAAHFVGQIDEVRLYNRALSASEVAAHCHSLAGRAH